MTAFLASIALFLLVLVILGLVADAWDPFGERADARRRNDQARRVR